ncbi:MAG: hypothetical protein IKW83_00465 [Muribaculaceae bacterium]|nr:hypothetical protein [Muribaculaceae bacterium]
MKTSDNRHYQAENGCFIVRKSDKVIMGEAIDLGSADSIDNYEDQPFTEESYRDFYASIGIDIDAKKQDEKPSKKLSKKLQ